MVSLCVIILSSRLIRLYLTIDFFSHNEFISHNSICISQLFYLTILTFFLEIQFISHHWLFFTLFTTLEFRPCFPELWAIKPQSSLFECSFYRVKGWGSLWSDGWCVLCRTASRSHHPGLRRGDRDETRRHLRIRWTGRPAGAEGQRFLCVCASGQIKMMDGGRIVQNSDVYGCIWFV